MRCHICNAILEPTEIKFSIRNKLEPCFTCKAKSEETSETYGDFIQELFKEVEKDGEKIRSEIKETKINKV